MSAMMIILMMFMIIKKKVVYSVVACSKPIACYGLLRSLLIDCGM